MIDNGSLNALRVQLQVISGAVDDLVGGRPIEDAVGEIGAAVDTALGLLPASEAGRPVLDREAVENAVAVHAFGYFGIFEAEIGSRDLGYIGGTTDAVMALARSEAEVKAEALREAAALRMRDGYGFAELLLKMAQELEAK